MLQPKRWTPDTHEIKKSDAQDKPNQRRPNLEWELHHLDVKQKGYAVAHEGDEDDKLPVSVDDAEANDW